jgi:glycosyltransferase involved in cell wall biosynthesis
MTKRIFIDCYFFEGEFQGTRTFIKEIYNKIFYFESLKTNTEKNLYYLVCHKKKYIESEFLAHDFVYYIETRFKNRFIRLLFEYPYIIARNKINFAHFQYIVPPIKFCKYIVTIHDILFCSNKQFFSFTYRIKNYLLFFISYLHSDIVTTVSENSRSNILKYFFLKKNILITPNGVNEKYFSYKSKLSKNDFLTLNKLRKYFLCVSRFEPRKNHLNLLKAFIHGKYYLNYDLILIGSKTLNCDEFDYYHMNLANDIKLKIHILNFGVSNEMLLDFYDHCEIFIYPSLFEGFGIPPLEASALGKPVICSNTTAMSDFSFYKKYHIFPSVENLNSMVNLILNDKNLDLNSLKSLKKV